MNIGDYFRREVIEMRFGKMHLNDLIGVEEPLMRLTLQDDWLWLRIVSSFQSLEQKGMHINFCLDIYFTKDYLHSFEIGFEKIFLQDTIRELCCQVQLIVNEIVFNQYNGIKRRIFVEGKVLELLLLMIEVNEIADNAECNSCRFLSNSGQKEKIQLAKEFVLSNLSLTPSISQISKAVGINECYLKKGFRELFGMSVYAFIQQQRINKAKLLLTTTHWPIAQIADELGFSTNANFTVAFKKHTGIVPRDLRSISKVLQN